MTQNGKNESCATCGKPWLTHHALAAISAEGKLSIHCYEQPVEKTDFVLKYVLENRAAKLALQTEVLDLKKKNAGTQQAIQAEAESEFEAKVRSAAAKKTAEEIIEIEADYKRQLEQAEETRVNLDSKHQAKVTHLEDLIKELRDDGQTLVEANKALEAKLAACEAKSVEQQLQIEELGKDRQKREALFGRMERALRKRTHEFRSVGVGSLSQTIRIGHLEAIICRYEKLHGALPDDTRSQGLEELLSSIEGDDPKAGSEDGLPVRAMPDFTPVPPPAPKAAVETPTPAPKAEVAQKAQPIATAEIVDPEPEASVSTDDASDGDGHGVDDEDIVASEDDASSEEERCSGCGKPATVEMYFTKKDGERARIVSCDSEAHTDEFWSHLKAAAKKAPKAARDVKNLFETINPNEEDEDHVS